MSKNTGTSELINYFDLGANGDVGIAGSLDVNTIANATTDTDKFLVSDTGIIKYRTGAELLSDIGAQGLLTNPVTGTGASGQVAYWSSGSAITGESNLFWDATNDRLGIGTNTFGEKLSVYGSAGADSFGFFSGGSGTTLAGIKMGNGGNIYGSLYFDNGSNDVILFQQFTSGNLRLGTNSTEKLRIFSDGNVLIQTGGTFTNAGYKLDVNGTGRFSNKLSIIDPTNNSPLNWSRTGGPIGYLYSDGDNVGFTNAFDFGAGYEGILLSTSTSSINFYTNGVSTPRLTIASTGVATFSGTGDDIVIIGKATASQNAYLQLNAGSAANAYINSIGSGNLILGANGAASNHLNITSGGNVGIGTPSVTTGKLVVKSGESNSTGIVLERQANTEKLVNIFSETADGKIAIASGTNINVLLNSAGTSYFTGGNVGINTASPLFYSALTLRAPTTANYTAIACEDSSSNILFFVRNDGLLNTGTRSASPYNNTNVNIANVYVGSDGLIYRSTASSLIYKENINDWNGSGLDTILALKPKTFTYKADYYKNPDVVMLGLIAEDVAEVSSYLAEYKNEDRTGQVENVRYATIVVPLIKAIQELKAELDELKSKN